MLRGPHLVLRTMTHEEVVPFTLYLNQPKLRDKDDFTLVSPTKMMNAHVRTSLLTEEEAVLVIDVGKAKHVGYARWYLANPAVGNLELDVEFYSRAHDTASNRCEAITLLAEYLFDDRPIERLQITLSPEDGVGIEAAKDAGFVKEGTLKQMFYSGGSWRHLELWSILREELSHA